LPQGLEEGWKEDGTYNLQQVSRKEVLIIVTLGNCRNASHKKGRHFFAEVHQTKEHCLAPGKAVLFAEF